MTETPLCTQLDQIVSLSVYDRYGIKCHKRNECVAPLIMLHHRHQCFPLATERERRCTRAYSDGHGTADKCSCSLFEQRNSFLARSSSPWWPYPAGDRGFRACSQKKRTCGEAGDQAPDRSLGTRIRAIRRRGCRPFARLPLLEVRPPQGRTLSVRNRGFTSIATSSALVSLTSCRFLFSLFGSF